VPTPENPSNYFRICELKNSKVSSKESKWKKDLEKLYVSKFNL